MKHDIENTNDIKLLVDSFYEKVKSDDTIGHIFNDVAKVNWDEHLPRMYSFWESILLGKASFEGNPMVKHILLSKKTPMKEIHFERWLKLWAETLDANFTGSKKEEAKTRGKSIADLMLFKINKSV